MKSAPFAYVRPTTLDDVIDELVATDGDSKVLAGGQSLVPVLAMRLARPGTLVDINAVPDLNGLEEVGDALRIGATVRQRRVERAALAATVPLLGMALPFVGHRELRSRGTVCGSLAHADPAAELPAVACCLDATLEVRGPGGYRQVAAANFFQSAMSTALSADDVLVAARFPVAGAGEGFGFAELARRHGDFALAGVAVRVCVRDGVVHQAVLCGFGISDRPVRRDITPQLTATTLPGDRKALEQSLRGPMTELAGQVVDTGGDFHGSQHYRRRLFAVLAAREVASAYHRAVAEGTRETS